MTMIIIVIIISVGNIELSMHSYEFVRANAVYSSCPGKLNKPF